MCEDIDTKNQQLTEIFAAVGKKYGYETVNAEFMAFREFKCTWQRSYKWIDFRISDYLEDAPKTVLEELATTLLQKIRGDDFTVNTKLKKYVTTKAFRDKHYKTYIDRCTDYEELDPSIIKRVCEKYGLDPVENCTLCKYSGEYTHKAAGCSVLMRVIGISDILFDENVPEFVRDFAIYCELQHILMGYDPDRNTEEEYEERTHKFPQYFEAQSEMRKLCVYL